MKFSKLIVRADGNSQMGLGHVYRTCALIAQVRHEFVCHFYIRNPSPAITNRILEVCDEIHPLNDDISADQEAEMIASTLEGNEIVLLDGYHFNTAYQEKIKARSVKMICIDDIHACHYLSDAVINHIGGISTQAYSHSTDTRLFLGPRYAILNQIFYTAKDRLGIKKQMDTLFLNLGGADPGNRTLEILKGITHFPHNLKKIFVVVGAAYNYLQELENFAVAHPFIEVRQHIPPEQIASLMAECGMAICSASTISYEYCSVGGLLFVIQTADNQAELIRYLLAEGLALPLESLEQVISDPVLLEKKYRQSVQKQRKVFDGKAGQRLRASVINLFLKDNLYCRPAESNDIDLLYDWANDPTVRQNSFNTNNIDYAEHQKWFGEKMLDANTRIYIFSTRNGINIANARFNINGSNATISYLIDAKFRGLGLGKEILQLATREFFSEYIDVHSIDGFVKPENTASRRSFVTACWEEVTHNDEKNICFNIKRTRNGE